MSNTLVSTTNSNLVGKDKRITTEVMLTPDRKLDLTTFQNFSGELVTHAKVLNRLTGANCTHMFGHRMMGDYSRSFAVNKVRMTAKAVEAQHNTFLAQLDDIIADANKYYGVSVLKVEA
jgi:hypothetical protein